MARECYSPPSSRPTQTHWRMQRSKSTVSRSSVPAAHRIVQLSMCAPLCACRSRCFCCCRCCCVRLLLSRVFIYPCNSLAADVQYGSNHSQDMFYGGRIHSVDDFLLSAYWAVCFGVSNTATFSRREMRVLCFCANCRFRLCAALTLWFWF